MLRLAQLCIFTLVEEWLPQETTAGQRSGEERRQRPSDESRPTALWLRSSAWSKAAWDACNAGGVATMPSSPGNNRREREWRERSRETSYIFGCAAVSSVEIQQDLLKKQSARSFFPAHRRRVILRAIVAADAKPLRLPG